MKVGALFRRCLVYLGFPLASIVITLIILEALLQLIAYHPPIIAPPEHRRCQNCPHLFEPIPIAGKTNSLGLNSPEISLEKPPSTFRIVILGDSITHGVGIDQKLIYPTKLEEILSSRYSSRKIEVVNAGVRGYSPYNEVRFLRDRLMKLSPDLVILQTCMNDIANPRWHWNAISRVEFVPPDDAFPRPEEKDIPHPDRAFMGKILTRSMIYSIGFLTYLKYRGIDVEKNVGVVRDGKFWPTYITAESDATLEPLTRYDSPEWEWMRRQFDIGVEITKSQGIPFMLLIVPLAYELNSGYPLNPEESYMRYCAERGLSCVNLRETLASRKPSEVFIYKGYSKLPRLPDIWHFNEAGHEVAAHALAERISSDSLIHSNDL